MQKSSYSTLGWTVGIHFVIMYLLTFSAVNVFQDIFWFNTRSFYMAIIMVSPMVILMLFFMRGMFLNIRLNFVLYFLSVLLFLIFFIFIRQQIFVGDRQFLNSMIPHHSGAITMCENATLTDPEIIELCDSIIQAQKEEINQMKNILNRF